MGYTCVKQGRVVGLLKLVNRRYFLIRDLYNIIKIKII